MIERTAERPQTTLAGALAVWALPWLCSTTVHIVLLLALALSYQWAFDRSSQRGSSMLASLEVSFISGQSPDNAAGDSAVELDSRDAGRYYDDEIAPATREAPLPKQGGGAGNSAALTALLNERPAVDLTGVLPASGQGLGSGGQEGTGVGSAQGLTAQPQGSNRRRGAMARTAVFGAVGEGQKFVYVFDRSGSMDGHAGAPLASAKSELLASLAHLDQTHQFQIIFYNDKPRVFNPTGVLGRLVFGTDQNKYLASKFVGSITADGATRHEEALKMALRMTPDVIFFLTDADQPQLSTEQLQRIGQMNNGTMINAIEFGYGAQSDADNFLVRLARQNGGTHVYVDVAQLAAPRR
ncbi:MAG: hypothetical protein AB7O59_16340 [Pirellulales bacterium]